MSEPPLEKAEWKILGIAVSDAKLRAARGDLMAGYECLMAGLRRMEEFVTGGDAWARDLLQAYRQEADKYKDTYPVSDGKPCASSGSR
jgi:hypothetical protein